MNVKELIEILKQFDDDTIVRFSYDYGDHWHTKMATEVKYADLQSVVYSGYHDDFIIDESEPDDDDEVNSDNKKWCLVLS